MKTSTVSIAGGPVHLADFGGSGPPVILVHGLGGSHTNWMSVGGELSRRARVLAFDLPGFGRTPLLGRSPGVQANVELLLHLIDEMVGEPVMIVGNSMGGMISLMAAAVSPERVSRLVLVCPALPIPSTTTIDPIVALVFAIYMTPGAGELFLRRRMAAVGPEKMMRDTLKLCGVDPSRLPTAVYEAGLALARERIDMPWANQSFIQAARSLMLINAQRSRVHELIRRVRAPTLLMQGTADRLVPFAASRAVASLRPDWSFEVMDGIGHVPQIEVPERWLEAVTRWLDRGQSGLRPQESGL